MTIEYRSVSDMNNAILKNLHRLPQSIDLVVGIPRSGMLPANLIALYLNKPFTDIDSFCEGRIYGNGFRKLSEGADVKRVLIIDDTINSGRALAQVREKLEQVDAARKYELYFGAVYATSESASKVDFFCEKIDYGYGVLRAFQWNIFHHERLIGSSCFDIDGVLCPDPPIDDDGEKYLEYISNAPVLLRPSCKIDTLVTCRLEKYREVTEKWLEKNGIQYNRLVMLDFKTKAERVAWGRHGQYKGEVYKKSDAILFVESNRREALRILKTSHKAVFCTENFELMNDGFSRLENRVLGRLWKLKSKILPKKR